MCMSLVVHLYLVSLDGCKQTKMQRAYTIYIYIYTRPQTKYFYTGILTHNTNKWFVFLMNKNTIYI